MGLHRYDDDAYDPDGTGDTERSLAYDELSAEEQARVRTPFRPVPSAIGDALEDPWQAR